MVNSLVATERTTEMLFHDEAMFEEISALSLGISHPDIAVRVDETPTLPSMVQFSDLVA